MIEFHAAMTRKSIKGDSREGWHPSWWYALIRHEMFTIWTAYADFQEKKRGSIEVDKLAGLTIGSHTLKIPDAKILKSRCLKTVIGNEIVHDASTIK